ILQVHATDLGTGKAQHITMSDQTQLSNDEIDKCVKQADQFADADKKYKEKVETKNEADTVLYTTEKALRDHGDKISQDERLAVDRAINEMKDALKGEDMDKVKKAKDSLIQVSQKLGEAVYKAAQAKAGPEAGAAGAGPAPEGAKAAPGGKDDVVDAEVVDEKK
ncbi:MAG: Hsp70 family protein, partial [Elusimicrobia bacterium]|nr:Hsp70 family protein [Elusimicrobiota bacterium]